MTTVKTPALPLARFKVLDLSRVRSGPTAVRQLADWGADVIKIEEPPRSRETEMGGQRLGADFQNLHRNKKSLTLNLKSPEGREVLLRLAEGADVVVENFRPDVKHRLGIDYDTVRSRNPKIVYASISGFGQDGPYARRPGYDQIIQGMAGLMSVTGIPGQGPVRAGVAIADTAAGLYCTQAILMALLEREQTGEGQWVQISLLESMLAVMDFQSVRWLVDGELPQQAGNDHPTIIPTGVFSTSDGQINICVSGAVMWERLCHTLGKDAWLDDPRFATNEARSDNRGQLNVELAEVFRHDTNENWIERLNAAGLACGPINNVRQAFEDPQVQHLGVRWPVNVEQRGEIGLVGQPYRSSRHAVGVRSPAPMAGAHTDEILGAAGYSAEFIARLKEKNVI